MPGIVGIFAKDSVEDPRYKLAGMLTAMYSEPFHSSGSIAAPELNVWAGWTAHRGSFAARQSQYQHPDGSRLLLAGECWSGTNAPSMVPAELLELYRERGLDFVKELNGLFSGLLVDPVGRRVLLFNDRYGSERLYTCSENGLTFFSSEAKALLQVAATTRAFDDRGVAEFVKYGTTLEDRTLFSGVSILPGGALWSFMRDGRTVKGRYFEPREWEGQSPLGETEFAESLGETLQATVPRYAPDHEHVGISITGGLDTRMIMACLPQNQANVICYTYAGETGETLDESIGRRVAGACGLEHRTLRITTDFLSGFSGHLDRTVLATDGCAGAAVVHELYLSRLARELSPVRLTGNYGSELLRSVSTFKPSLLTPSLLDPQFRLLVDSTAADYGRMHPVTRAAFREIPLQLYGSLAAGRSQLTCRTPYLDNTVVKLAYRGSEQSRHSATAALAVVKTCRPELARIASDRGFKADDSALASLVRRGWGQLTFKLDYFDKEGLPDWLRAGAPLLGMLRKTKLLGQHKYLPYREWFRQELSDHLRQVATDPRTRRMPYWSPDFLPTMVENHCSGRRNHLPEINVVLTLEAVERLLIKGWSDRTMPAETEVRAV